MIRQGEGARPTIPNARGVILLFVYIFIVFMAITGLTWWLMGAVLGEDFRRWVEPMSDSHFAMAFVRAAIIATLASVGWITAITWPPTADKIHSMSTNIVGALVVIQPLGISGFFLWLFLKESRRRKSKA